MNKLKWMPFICYHPSYSSKSGITIWKNQVNLAISVTCFEHTFSLGLVKKYKPYRIIMEFIN